MNVTDTARLRALLAAATPRPWMKHGRHTVTANVRRWDIDVCKTGNVADGTAEADAELIAEAVNALPGLIAENERMRAANVKSRILGLVEGFNSAASVEVKQQEDQIGALENALRAIVAIQGAAMRDKDKLDRAYKIAREALNAKG